MAELAVVFGASGFLGGQIVVTLREAGLEVVPVGRSDGPSPDWVSTSQADWENVLAGRQATRVIWAQGENASGSILDDSLLDLERLFKSNVSYVVETLQRLLGREVVVPGTRLCVISSVWQNCARNNKMAYVTSKAALAGLVGSLAADLGPRGIAVNAVLPGLVDSPMTRSFVSADEIRAIEQDTPMRQLVSAEQLAEVVLWLTSFAAGGISGQSIVVDNGWSGVRYV